MYTVRPNTPTQQMWAHMYSTSILYCTNQPASPNPAQNCHRKPSVWLVSTHTHSNVQCEAGFSAHWYTHDANVCRKHILCSVCRIHIRTKRCERLPQVVWEGSWQHIDMDDHTACSHAHRPNCVCIMCSYIIVYAPGFVQQTYAMHIREPTSYDPF